MVGALYFFMIFSFTSFLQATATLQDLPILSFDEGYTQLFGDSNLMLLKDGKTVHISLDERTGAGFASQDLYLHGFFSASIKLPADYTAGVVVAFYMSNGDIFEKTHDELDFDINCFPHLTMEPAGSHYNYGRSDDYSANYPYAQTFNVNIPTAHQFQPPHSTPYPQPQPQPQQPLHNAYVPGGMVNAQSTIENYQIPHTQQAHIQQAHTQQANGFSPVHSPVHTPMHSVHDFSAYELQTTTSESEIALTEKNENFTIRPSLQPIKSGPIDRPKINEDPSPMLNPSSWTKLVWLGFAFLNMYTLLASILLIKFYYSELGGHGKMLARSAFLLITAFELLPRLVNIYQIYKYTNHSLSLIEGLGVLLAKKEAYLLIGRLHLSQSQVDRLGVTSDLICLLYICWLGFAFVSDLGGIRERTGKETDHKLLTLGISLSVAIVFLVGRIIWQIMLIARNYHVRRRKKNDLEKAQEISNDNGYQEYDDSVEEEKDKKKKDKKKKKKDKKGKKGKK